MGRKTRRRGFERERLIGGVVVCLHLRADHCEFTARPLAGVVPDNAVKNAITKWIVDELEYVEVYADPLDVADALWGRVSPPTNHLRGQFRMRLSLLLLMLGGWAVAAPPVVPPKIEVKTGKSHQFQVKAEGGKKIGWAKTFPAGVVTLFRGHSDDASVYEYLLIGEVDGTYFIPFWTEGETTAAITQVVVGKGATEPPPVVDPPTDPTKPPVVGGKLYFCFVQPDGPQSDAVRKSATLPAWEELRAAGHTMKQFPLSALPASVPKPEGVPSVVVLQIASDGKSSTHLWTRKAPANDAEVKALATK